MPYSRRRTTRRRYTRRSRPSYRGRRTPFRTRVRRAVQSFSEKKFTEVTYVSSECAWDGRMHSYNSVSQGDGATGRDANMIQPIAIAYDFTVYNNAAADTNQVTFIWFRDSQQVSDTSPGAADILSQTFTVAAPNSLLSTASRGRFKVIRRITRSLGQAGTDTSAAIIKGFIRLPRNFPIHYNSTSSTDVNRNGLYLLIISSADPAANEVFIDGMTRMWYTDV